MKIKVSVDISGDDKYCFDCQFLRFTYLRGMPQCALFNVEALRVDEDSFIYKTKQCKEFIKGKKAR